MTSAVRHLTEAGFLGKFYIDGKWRKPTGSATAVVINPATEQPIAEVALGNDEDVEYAVAAARQAFAGWSCKPAAERTALLDRIHGLLLDRLELFAQALTSEMGAAITYARRAQVPLAAEHIRVARDNLATYSFISPRGSTAIMREAIGVCGLITPWNWPLYQITAKVGPALAAGCTVVLKPSELSPLSALLFAEVMDDAGCPPGVFNLVNGTGPVVGTGLASHPQVDMISITGSTRAGVLVAQAAAPTVKRVAQELGGKSPNIILPDAELSRAVPLGVGAAFRNLGQSCSAPTRMLVSRSQMAKVEVLAAAAASEIVVGDPLAESTTHGPIANRPQFERIQTMIGVGLEEGAKLVIGGPGRPGDLQGRLLCAADDLLERPSRHEDCAARRSSARCCRSFPTIRSTRRSRSPTTLSTASAPMCRARIWRRYERSPGRSGPVRSISTIPTGTRTHLLADTSVPATAGNTASRVWRNISRPRPFSDFIDERYL